MEIRIWKLQKILELTHPTWFYIWEERHREDKQLDQGNNVQMSHYFLSKAALFFSFLNRSIVDMQYYISFWYINMVIWYLNTYTGLSLCALTMDCTSSLDPKSLRGARILNTECIQCDVRSQRSKKKTRNAMSSRGVQSRRCRASNMQTTSMPCSAWNSLQHDLRANN